MDLQNITQHNTCILRLHKTIVIQTDASEYGFGAALLQDGRPTVFASQTLTDVETRYANIECKCLSVCFGLEKFYTYSYGQYITVHNDNKPLEMIEKYHSCCTASLTKSVIALREIQLYHSIQTWEENGLGRLPYIISFLERIYANRATPKYL